MINFELVNFYLTAFINVFIVFPSLIYLYCFMRKKEKEKEQKVNFLKLINVMNEKYKNREYHQIDGLSFNLYQLIVENKNLFKNEKEEIDFFKNNFSQFFKKEVSDGEIAGRIIVNYKNGDGDYCLILKKDILYHSIYNYFLFCFEKRAYELKKEIL